MRLPHDNLILVGPPGAGKSTIGRRLSRALNQPLVDTDVLIEETIGEKCGEIFQRLGEPAFRELEAQVVAEAITKSGIISLGGGAVVTPATRELLKPRDVVWIDVSAEEGARRTAPENTRPVLAAENPLEHYRTLLVEREPWYSEVATCRVKTDNKTPQRVVSIILGKLDTL